MFIAAQFTIVKCWKQPKYPSANEWIKKLWYTLFFPGNTKWRMTPVLRKDQEGLEALEREVGAASEQDLASASRATVAARVGSRLWSSLRQGQG